MTRRVTAASRSYAQGSHKQLGAYPRTCAGCGGRVRISLDTCWQETTPDGVLLMWHAACRLERVRPA